MSGNEHARFVEESVESRLISALRMDNAINSKQSLRIFYDGLAGFLNNRDFSKHVGKDTIARQAFRSGVCQFMAANLLSDPEGHNTLQYDLESFLWVIVFHILCYMRHNIPPDKLEETIQRVFDTHIKQDVGKMSQYGLSKYVVLTGLPLSLLRDLQVDDNKPLTLVFLDTVSYFSRWYRHINLHQQEVKLYTLKHRISREVADAMFPLDTSHLALANHQAILQLFSEALANEDQWPAAPEAKVDFFAERLRDLPGPQEHLWHSDKYHGLSPSVSAANSLSSVGSHNGTKRPKKRRKLNDEAEYGSSFTPFHE